MKLIALLLTVLAVVAAAVGDAADEAKKMHTNDSSDTKARDQLMDQLFANYKTYNYPENSTVKFALTLLNVDFDLDHDYMNSKAWLRYMWTDSRFTWSAQETGVNVLRVPSSKVWLPDITLYNGVSPKMQCWDTNVILYPDGTVLWVPPCSLQSYCNLTLAEHPFKEQTCILKFGSWTFDQLTIGLDFFDAKHEAGSEYYNGRKFKITTNTAKMEDKHYDCCAEPYRDITYTVGFTQQSKGDIMCSHDH